jgi:hypothetical protein
MSDFEMEVTVEEEDGSKVTHKLPSKYEVCNRCRKGSYVNPNIDRNRISPEELRNYFSGLYDVQCAECDGLRVVKVVDTNRLSTNQRKVFQLWMQQEEEHARFEAECRHEQEMEARMLGCW